MLEAELLALPDADADELPDADADELPDEHPASASANANTHASAMIANAFFFIILASFLDVAREVSSGRGRMRPVTKRGVSLLATGESAASWMRRPFFRL